MIVTLIDFESNIKKILDSISENEEIIITKEGKPFAKLSAISDATELDKNDQDLFGIWQDYLQTENVENYVRDMRKGRYDAR